MQLHISLNIYLYNCDIEVLMRPFKGTYAKKRRLLTE